MSNLKAASFKAFLGEDALRQLVVQLFFQHEIGLSKNDAKEAVEWFQSTLLLPHSVSTDWWKKVVEWAESMHALSNSKDKNRKSLKDLAKGPVPLPLLVKGVIAKSVNNLKSRSSINEAADLEELRFMLALRKEYQLTKEQAYEVIEWLRDEKDWQWLSDGVRQTFYDIWDPDTPDRHPGMSYGDFVVDEIHLTLKKHYQLDTRDLLG